MNQEVRAKLLDALHSGEYRFCCGELKRVERYGALQGKTFNCLLGVLSDLYIKEFGTFHWENDELCRTCTGTRHLGFPPQEILDWAGISIEVAKEWASNNDLSRSWEEVIHRTLELQD